jgi:hypothetical protein
MNNLTGQSFGSLTVLQPSLTRSSTGEIVWEVSCDCGRRTSYRASKLSQGKRVSCGQCSASERKPRSAESRKRDRSNQGKLHFSQIPLKKQLNIVNEFLFEGDYKKLSDKHRVTQDTLRNGIKMFRERLNIMYELNYMANAQKTELSTEVIEKALQTDFVSEALRDMLSDDTTEILTPQEIMYCYLFVNTGSNQIALKESQLDTCLTQSTPVRLQYLGMHLREKPNIKQYIQALQAEQVDEVVASKKLVQHELIKQVEQLKEVVAHGGKPSDRSNLIKCIELLGKTCKAFEEHVKIEGVSAASALDDFLEMAKQDAEQLGQAKVKELPPGSPVDENYAYQDERENQGVGG